MVYRNLYAEIFSEAAGLLEKALPDKFWKKFRPDQLNLSAFLTTWLAP